jgi:hypothetical protein
MANTLAYLTLSSANRRKSFVTLTLGLGCSLELVGEGVVERGLAEKRNYKKSFEAFKNKLELYLFMLVGKVDRAQLHYCEVFPSYIRQGSNNEILMEGEGQYG